MTYLIRCFWETFPDISSLLEIEADSPEKALADVYGMTGEFILEQGGGVVMLPLPTSAEIVDE